MNFFDIFISLRFVDVNEVNHKTPIITGTPNVIASALRYTHV